MKYQGLTELEAQKIYIQNGPNEIPFVNKSFILNSILKTLLEPMMLILLLACLVYFFIGEFRDFTILTFSALIIFSINIYQNYTSEEAIKKLKSFTKIYSEVIREGKKQIIETKYLVEGDYVIVSEGDRLPADIIILETSNLLIDESILTGESLPIQKTQIKDSKIRNFEDSNLAFSGSLILSGWLVGIVFQTGVKTKVGQIGKRLELIKDEEPQVKKEINKIVFNLAILCIFTCLFIFGYNFYVSNDFINSLIRSVSLAIALVPEELPIVLTIFLALSSLRLSKQGLIVKNKAIVETLGATNILCVDKTGTITKNNLKLKKVILNNYEYEIENLPLRDDVKELIEASYLATYFNSKDTSDLEIVKTYENSGIDTSKYESIQEGVIAKNFIYSKKYLYRKQFYTFAKGAYEQISKICRINEEYEDFYLNKIEELSKVGYRIIAVCSKKEFKDSSKKYNLLGLLAFQDEVREEVAEYIELCQKNNLRVCLITGDYKNTAIYFAREIGLNNYSEVITGEELEKLDDEKLKNKIAYSNVFARITPKQKLKIVNFLKSSKNIVAMTGDGVNDVLALKSANVGISIGKGGSDVAKEASDVILIENNLKNIVNAIIEGRRIYKNLGTTGRYIYSFHLPIVLIAIFNTIFQLPQLLLPIHIAILEFIIDPFSTLVFESIPADKNLLAEKPRRGKFKLIENLDLKQGTYYGLLMFLLIFIPFYIMQINGFEDYINISLINILALNIVLIWLNFKGKQEFKSLINNQRFFYSNLILLIFFIIGLLYLNISLLGVGIILTTSILFLSLGILTNKSGD
jgi:Ca2+-transporting ATPase